MSEIIEKQTNKQALKPPSMWNVVFLNDDFTTVEFVMALLIGVFSKTEEQARSITKDIHEKGKGIVGKYTKEIASTKQSIAMEYAQKFGHPLQIVIEEIPT